MSAEWAVHVVDDDPDIRRSISRLIRAAGLLVEVYESGASFLKASSDVTTGCVLVDVRMSGMDGLELLARLRAKGFALPVIMISGYGDIPTAVRAMKNGANDFIEKQFDREVLIGTILRAMEEPDNSKRLQERSNAAMRIASLSPREKQVLYGIIEGRSSKLIAFDLGLSARTVEVHRARMMERLGVKHVAEAVRLAVLARISS